MIDKINNLVQRHEAQIKTQYMNEVDTILNIIQIDKLHLGSPYANLNKNFLTDFEFLKPKLLDMISKVMTEDKRIKGIKDLMNQFSKQFRNFAI